MTSFISPGCKCLSWLLKAHAVTWWRWRWLTRAAHSSSSFSLGCSLPDGVVELADESQHQQHQQDLPGLSHQRGQEFPHDRQHLHHLAVSWKKKIIRSLQRDKFVLINKIWKQMMSSRENMELENYRITALIFAISYIKVNNDCRSLRARS